MKLSPLSLIFLTFLLCSCKHEPNGNTINKTHYKDEVSSGSLQDSFGDCEKFWKLRYPSDETKKIYVEKILSEGNLTENNKKFISALMTFPLDILAPQEPIYPIFRLSDTQAGIFSFPNYESDGTSFQDISAEDAFIRKYSEIRMHHGINETAEYFFPGLMEALLEIIKSPEIFYYSLTGRGESRIENFGVKFGECLDYYIYLFTRNEKIERENLLFGSPYKLDLVYENFPQIDSLLKTQYKNECLDCPNSYHLEKTFARLKGTENVYFVYADTFPLNDQLETPSRGIIFIDESNEAWHLWYEDIDHFGCDCL